MTKCWASYDPLLYPGMLFGLVPPVSLTESLSKVYDFRTALPMGQRVPLLFKEPVRLLVRVSSRIGTERDWRRAGSLAQVVFDVPGRPKKSVSRLYLDDRFFEFDAIGHFFYFEFWAVHWLTDYHLEIWAQRGESDCAQALETLGEMDDKLDQLLEESNDIVSTLLTIAGELLTVAGTPIIT